MNLRSRLRSEKVLASFSVKMMSPKDVAAKSYCMLMAAVTLAGKQYSST